MPVSIDIESIPGFKLEKRRSYVYVQCDDHCSFRRLFAEIQIVLDAPLPKSGAMMNKEKQLLTPVGEVYCAISLSGDQEAWRNVVQVYCCSRQIKTAHVLGRDLVISNGERVQLDFCTLTSSHGI
jgi:hypothetical protein